MDNDVSHVSLKLVLVGDSGVGKSSLVARYNTGVMPESISPTVGAGYLSKIYSYQETEIELRIWDTAGQETYQSLTPIYFKNSAIALVVFDISRKSSFLNVPKWIEQFKEYAESNTLVVLVANKVDLESGREVSVAEYTEFATQNNLILTEVSAKTGHNVNYLIENAVSTYIQSDNDFQYELNNQKRKMHLVNEKQQCC